MIDIYNNYITRKKISFSGTVNFVSPAETICSLLDNKLKNKKLIECQIYEPIPDDVVGGAIEASIYGITTSKPNIELYRIKENNIEIENEFIEYFKNYMENENNKDKIYHSLIDSVGLIMEKKVHDIVEIIIDINIKTKFFDYIYYVDIDNNNNSIRKILDIKYIEKKVDKNYIINNSINYNNNKNDRVFIYYDNRHCVGIDFKQPSNMNGLILLGKTSILTDVA